MMTRAWFEEPWWSSNMVRQCKVKFVMFFFCHYVSMWCHCQVICWIFFLILWCVSHDNYTCVVCGEHWSFCFVICMQVWVFKHFNSFLLSFPHKFFLGYLSNLFILSILSFLFISNWSNYVHFYPFSPTSWVCIFYLLFILSILFTTNWLSIFFYYVYYKLTFCGFCEFWVCVLWVFCFCFFFLVVYVNALFGLVVCPWCPKDVYGEIFCKIHI
jgi:hypothetical protein